MCGCCPVCARQEGQGCGGPWNYLGTCDVHLRCVRLELEEEEEEEGEEDDKVDDDDDYDDHHHVTDYVNDESVFGYHDDADDDDDDEEEEEEEEEEEQDNPNTQKLSYNGSITIHSIEHKVDHLPTRTEADDAVMTTTKRVRHRYHYDRAAPTAGATADNAAANRQNKAGFEPTTSDVDRAVKVGNGRKPGDRRQTLGRFPVVMTTEDEDDEEEDEEEEGTCVKLSDVRGYR